MIVFVISSECEKSFLLPSLALRDPLSRGRLIANGQLKKDLSQGSQAHRNLRSLLLRLSCTSMSVRNNSLSAETIIIYVLSPFRSK